MTSGGGDEGDDRHSIVHELVMVMVTFCHHFLSCGILNGLPGSDQGN